MTNRQDLARLRAALIEHEFLSYDDATEALDRADGLIAAAEKLRDAYRHYRAVQQQGKSEFIKENGRFGGSPWAELCDAIDAYQ